MTTKKALLIGSGVIILASVFVLGYLSYQRTVPVNYTPDQQQQMMLPLLLLYYGDADTPENRAKYMNMPADQMRAILNTPTDGSNTSATIY